VVPPDPLPPTPSTSPVMKTPENTEEDPDDSEPADKGDIQKKHSSDYFNYISMHFYSSIINHQQMHLRIIKKFNIFLGMLLHVSALRCHPQGALKFLARITHNYDIKM
jgi:hypothetical protein